MPATSRCRANVEAEVSHEDDRKEMTDAYAGGVLTVPVSCCKECPFFGKSIVSMLAARRDPNAGQCSAPVPRLMRKGGGVLLDRPLPVTDNRVRPTWCPLRIGDITVTATD